jgi:HK97 family phage portal protein
MAVNFEWLETRALSSQLDSWSSLFPDYRDSRFRRVTACWRCMTIIADSVAQLPLHVVQYDDQGKRAGVDRNHVAARALARPMRMTSFHFMRSMGLALAGYGNAFAEIVQSPNGRVSLRFIHPAYVHREFEDHLPAVYRVHSPVLDEEMRPSREIPAMRMIHVVGYSFDGGWGVSPIEAFRAQADYDRALTSFARDLYENGSRMSGIIEVPGRLDPEVQTRLREQFSKRHARGGTDAGKVGVLAGGMKFTQAPPMSATDADYVNAKRLSVAEIAMVWGVPPHMLGFLENATLNNVDAMNRDLYLKQTLLPYVRAFEAEFSRKLLATSPSREFEADLTRYLRGSPKEMAEALQIRVNGGWWSRNEAREAEGKEPGGDELDEYLVPSGVTIAGAEPAAPAQAPATPVEAPGDGDEAGGGEEEDEDEDEERAFSVVNLRPDGSAGRVMA